MPSTDVALMAGDLRIDHSGTELPEPAERAFLVDLGQARMPRIGREGRCKPAFDASWPFGLHGGSPFVQDLTPTSGERALGIDESIARRMLGKNVLQVTPAV
jgi:hypothetical protein